MGVWGAALQGVLAVDSNMQASQADAKQTAANVELANNAAADALQRAVPEAGAVRSGGTQLAAAQNVAYSNSGVDASVGTPATVTQATKDLAARNALTIENNAAREAWGYKKHGIAYQTQAGIDASRRDRETAGTVLGSIGQGAAAYSKTGFGV